MKKCSSCGAEYADDAVMCPLDRTPLTGPSPALKKEHSRLGIAAFVIACVVICVMMADICVAGVLSAHREPGARMYPGQRVIGLILLFLTAFDVVAIGLGIAGLCQTEKNRVFAILGLAFSVLTILGVFGLMIIGLMMMHAMAR
jgi:hypothetical protein